MRARQVLPPFLPDRGGVRELTAHLRCNIDLYLWIHTEQMARRAAEMEDACLSLTIRKCVSLVDNSERSLTLD